jgi:hypothetical protein
VRFRDRAMREPAIHCVNAADERGLPFAGFSQAQIGEQFNVAIRDIR